MDNLILSHFNLDGAARLALTFIVLMFVNIDAAFEQGGMCMISSVCLLI